MSKPAVMRARVHALVEAVADEHGVRVSDLRGRSRGPHLNVARQHAFASVRQVRGPTGRPPSYLQIGRWFGRDHSTVLHGVQRHHARQSEGA